MTARELDVINAHGALPAVPRNHPNQQPPPRPRNHNSTHPDLDAWTVELTTVLATHIHETLGRDYRRFAPTMHRLLIRQFAGNLHPDRIGNYIENYNNSVHPDDKIDLLEAQEIHRIMRPLFDLRNFR